MKRLPGTPEPLPECAGPCGLPMTRADHERHAGVCPSCTATLADLAGDARRLALHFEMRTPHDAR